MNRHDFSHGPRRNPFTPGAFVMIDLTREMIAYGIIGAVMLTVLPFVLTVRRRRHYEKLRRRGIKRHGH